MRPVKCPYCDVKLPRGEAIQHTNKRYYHKECYEEWRGQADSRGLLIEYIMKLYGIKKPTGMMLMQIKRFHEEFDYTYKGMELTLRYFYEILGNNMRDGDGIGIIPYMYEEATQQYIQQLKINESIEGFEESEKMSVYISPNRERRGNRYKVIDIESL